MSEVVHGYTICNDYFICASAMVSETRIVFILSASSVSVVSLSVHKL